ncbi:MAG: hypothetical protein RQ842_10675, partial [Vulcanisaeta sp.]|nr:hypothetical protein [Vulcanisaeta sp.]
QNQQKAQVKPQGKSQQQQRQQPQSAKQGWQQPRDDFGHEWLNKVVEAEQVKGAGVVVIRGRVTDVSKYWLKIAVDGQTLYVNKAFILSIKPLEMKDSQGGPNAGEQSSKSR